MSEPNADIIAKMATRIYAEKDCTIAHAVQSALKIWNATNKMLDERRAERGSSDTPVHQT